MQRRTWLLAAVATAMALLVFLALDAARQLGPDATPAAVFGVTLFMLFYLGAFALPALVVLFLAGSTLFALVDLARRSDMAAGKRAAWGAAVLGLVLLGGVGGPLYLVAGRRRALTPAAPGAG